MTTSSGDGRAQLPSDSNTSFVTAAPSFATDSSLDNAASFFPYGRLCSPQSSNQAPTVADEVKSPLSGRPMQPPVAPGTPSRTGPRSPRTPGRIRPMSPVKFSTPGRIQLVSPSKIGTPIKPQLQSPASGLESKLEPASPVAPMLTLEEQRRHLTEKNRLAALALREKRRKEQGMNHLARFGLAVAEPDQAMQYASFDPNKPRRQFTPNPQLCEEQLEVVNAVKERRNVFYTGSAGCGKSFTLQNVCELLQAEGRAFQVTAPSGIAAINVGGMTVHSFAQVGLGDKGWETYCKGLDKLKTEKWRMTDVLIIDEVSMLAVDLFEKIDHIARYARKDVRPFGGMQVILCGDFCQLPPVSVEKKCRRCGNWQMAPSRAPPLQDQPKFYDTPEWVACSKCKHKVNKDALYIFESMSWKKLNLKRVMLKRVFRQADEEFVDCLNRLRFGEISEADMALLRKCVRPLVPVSAASAETTQASKQTGGKIDIVPTNLHPTRAEVDKTNKWEFGKIQDVKMTYSARDRLMDDDGGDYRFREALNKGQAPEELSLAVGAQVMLIKNLDFGARLVNGSRGVVVDFVDSKACADELARGGGKEALEKALEDLQAFSAQNGGDAMRLPVVLFCTGATKIIHPATWEMPITRKTTAVRCQIPLIHAWAITIHKCQGMTLDRAFINIAKVFSPGQAYVALSRCRSLEGMQIGELRPEVIRADPKVVKFYRDAEETGPSSDKAPGQGPPSRSTRSEAMPSFSQAGSDWERTMMHGIRQYRQDFAADRELGNAELEKQLFLETVEEIWESEEQRARGSTVQASQVPMHDSHGRSTRLALVPQKRQLEPIELSDDSSGGDSDLLHQDDPRRRFWWA